MPHDRALIRPFADLNMADVPTVGGKNASLGELVNTLVPLGVAVPDGFAITAEAFRCHLRQAGFEDWVYAKLDDLDITDTAALAETAAVIRRRVTEAPLPTSVREAVLQAYRGLCDAVSTTSPSETPPSAGPHSPRWLDVAVRSSATAEDLPTASFAGQHETFLNVRGPEALDIAVRACMASLFTDRAIVYRVNNKVEHRAVALSVGVQRMVRADVAEPYRGCAGTMFTLDTESGFRGVVTVDASWGLGESVVQGRVSPDEYVIHKDTARRGFRSIIRRELGSKSVKLVYAVEEWSPSARVREVEVPQPERDRFTLSDEELTTLARWGMLVEDHYSKRAGRDVPMDIEWAKDGRTGQLMVLQARPETVHSRRDAATLDTFRLKGRGSVLVEGRSVGSRIGAGAVRIVRSLADLQSFREGEVLVAPMTDPDWEPVLRKAAGVITDRGGRTCHAAIVSREMGLACVVGAGNATELLRTGRPVTVSCAEGDVGKVYDGPLAFERTEVKPHDLPASRVPLMLNLADPARAFSLCQFPVAGVGLMRIEFLISKWIGVHPMAAVRPEWVPDAAARGEIAARAAAYSSPSEYFVDRLASGIAQICAAFYPRPVTVRFSDFKSNEYASLIGGATFEPKEDNPMIGFRGASRYYDERYREGFALECESIRRVRERMGLVNAAVMIPFCRTLNEARSVLAEMASHGLERGRNGLQVLVMCEIPNNVVLAAEFSELFDGFSIGSNDLTQLTLGVDRDSDLLTHIFDERDPGVKRLIETVVIKAHARGRKVGICGEAPSNYPGYAEFLADAGIDSISLNADSLAVVAQRLSLTPVQESSAVGATETRSC